MFVYKITNKINNKVYIGITTKCVVGRFYKHNWDAENGNGYYLHNAMRKYGAQNFTCETLFEADSLVELKAKEIEYIKEYDSFGCGGYNLTKGGDFSANHGYVVVRDKEDNFLSVPQEESDDYIPLNKDRITIFMGEESIRVTPLEYRSKYFDMGYRSKNYGYTTVITDSGEVAKIRQEEFDSRIHRGVNHGKMMAFNKLTEEIEQIKKENVDLSTYCNIYRVQYEIHHKGEITLVNSKRDIPIELGLKQFRYLWKRNKNFDELTITEEVLKKLKIKNREYSLVGQRLLKRTY